MSLIWLRKLATLFDLPKLEQTIAEAERKMDDPNFWSDQRTALGVVNSLKGARKSW